MDEEIFSGFPTPLRKKTINKLPSNPEKGRGRFPSWLHQPMPKGSGLVETSRIIKKYGLNVVCEEAKCPNRLQCYSHKTATFLALGSACTRSCGFCDIDFTKTPLPPDPDEPNRIAASIKELGLRHAVITMVARDDLSDGGARHIVEIIRSIRSQNGSCTIEVLVSDLNGNTEAIQMILDERPEVFNHNLETVRALTPRVRHKATYDKSLDVLRYARKSGKVDFIKSGIMVGLGETDAQVLTTIRDLREVGCNIMTIGHYLQAHVHRLMVKQFISLEQFKKYEIFGYNIGMVQVYSGPFVRSSFNAEEVVRLAKEKTLLTEESETPTK